MSVCLFSPHVPHNWSIFDFIAQYNLVKSTKYEGPHYAQRTCKSPEVQSLDYLRSSERKNIDSFTYALTPWRIIIPEKLIGFQLVKKFPAFYGTPKFITAFTRACYLSLSWARSTQSMPPSHRLKIHLNLSSQLCLGLPTGLFPSGVPTKTL